MPIVGLTDTVAPRFPRLGKLRKGGPKTGNKPGEDLTHFRFDGEGEIASAFADAYGQAPATLHVYLPFGTIDECFQTWKEKWVAGGLVHRCDGKTMHIWRNGNGYSREARACDGGCDEVGRLEVILPELIRAGFVGYVTLETHGINDMLGLQATLAAAYAARHDLRGIEFVLRRVEREISTPSPDGKRVRRKKWIVELAPAPRWAQMQLALAQAAALGLEAPADTVDQVTGEIVAEQPALAAPVRPALPAPAPAPAPAAPAPAPKPTSGNGNGQHPQDKERDKLRAEYAALKPAGERLSVPAPKLANNMTNDEIKAELGRFLQAVAKAAGQLIARHPKGVIDLDETPDQTIAQALRLLDADEAAQAEPEALHA